MRSDTPNFDTFHGALGQLERRRDLSVAEPPPDEFEDAKLALGQLVVGGGHGEGDLQELLLRFGVPRGVISSFKPNVTGKSKLTLATKNRWLRTSALVTVRGTSDDTVREAQLRLVVVPGGSRLLMSSGRSR